MAGEAEANRWSVKNVLEMVALVITVCAALWGLLMLFNPIREKDLSVLIERETAVSFPPEAGQLPIQLMYEGRSISNASLVKLEIINTGSVPLMREQQQKWTLDLRNPDGATVVPIRPVRPSARKIEADFAEKKPASNIVTLEIGILNPKDRIGVDVMLIEPKGGTRNYPIVGETLLPDLSEVFTSRYNIHNRLRNAFIVPVFTSLFVGLMGLAIRERLKLNEAKGKIDFVHSIPGMVIVSFWGAVLFGVAVTWAIAHVAVLVLAK